jgi:hypothetical protein
MFLVKLLCLLVVSVAEDMCEISDIRELGKCMKCCPDVVCPAAPPCPKVDCGAKDEEEEVVEEEAPYRGPVPYKVIAWISIALTFIPLMVIFIVDKMNLPMFKKANLE